MKDRDVRATSSSFKRDTTSGVPARHEKAFRSAGTSNRLNFAACQTSLDTVVTTTNSGPRVRRVLYFISPFFIEHASTRILRLNTRATACIGYMGFRFGKADFRCERSKQNNGIVTTVSIVRCDTLNSVLDIFHFDSTKTGLL